MLPTNSSLCHFIEHVEGEHRELLPTPAGEDVLPLRRPALCLLLVPSTRASPPTHRRALVRRGGEHRRPLLAELRRDRIAGAAKRFAAGALGEAMVAVPASILGARVCWGYPKIRMRSPNTRERKVSTFKYTDDAKGDKKSPKECSSLKNCESFYTCPRPPL
jgi:hypothetical protein